MPDFSTLLRPSAASTKRPPALPADDYPAIVKSWETGDSNRNRTPYVRLHLAPTGWGPSVPDTWEAVDPATNKTYTVAKADVDPSRRQFRRDFFLTEDAYWRLNEFIVSCGIPVEVEADGTVDYNPLLPQIIGAPVTMEVQQYLNQSTNEIGNQVGRVVGGAAGA